MRTIDMDHWSRREHFNLFRNFDHPHFGMSANVDLTSFYAYVKERGLHFTVAVIYMIARAANSIPEFRYRIRDEGVIEHDVVHPSATILVGKDTFSFCTVEYTDKFAEFAPRAAEQLASVKENPTLSEGSYQDDLLYMTALPWVTFTSFIHPLHLNPPDSVPRFAWGKYFEEAKRLKMPLGAQGHHALMDGIHMGWFYERIQGYLDEPEVVLSEI